MIYSRRNHRFDSHVLLYRGGKRGREQAKVMQPSFAKIQRCPREQENVGTPNLRPKPSKEMFEITCSINLSNQWIRSFHSIYNHSPYAVLFAQSNFPAIFRSNMENKRDLAPPHLLIFLFPAQCHINSVLKLAELLAFSGLNVTFLNYEYNHECLVRYTDIEAHFSRYWISLPKTR